MNGATAKETAVSSGASCHMIAAMPAIVTRACNGVKTSSSTTVWTAHESPATRSMVSPIGCLRCSRSDLRWTLAKTSRTTSNTIACPTTSQSIVSATSRAVAAANTATSAATTQTSSP